MQKRACDTPAKCTDEAKEYNKQRYDNTHMEPDFKEEDHVLDSQRNSPGNTQYSQCLVKPYFQTGGNKFPCRKKTTTPPDIVELEDFPGLVKKLIKARKIRLNGKDQRQYLATFKIRQQTKTNGWQRMPYQMGNLIQGDSGPLGGLKISLINDEPFLEGEYVSL
ncbi:hypothetical protein O181_102459 [Austropuccinia psidii MF-1]|uniref:Uncharacterized protein n=1 Tax=Austropuccinia psidii MF-1 TaxID=1389203 RepID=A0A9Q3PI95_9BASI|nr:hypothetical protein [Austropuccinia psidii MF-1]